MLSTGAERQRQNPRHGRYRQVPVEVGEQVAPAGRLPPKFQYARGYLDEQQVGFAPEVARCRFPDLRCGREVDEAIPPIDSRPREDASRLGEPPLVAGNDLVDDRR